MNSQQYRANTSAGTREDPVKELHGEEVSAANPPKVPEDVVRKLELDAHENDDNPHGVTASDVGALEDTNGSVDEANLSFDPATQTELDAHEGDESNPHNVTAAQTGAAADDHDHSGETIAPRVVEYEAVDVRTLNPSSVASAWHDGTGGNTVGLAQWDGAQWMSLIDGSVIA